jgi:hypothetical protein
MKPNQIARQIWRYWEALAHATDYDALSEITARVERLERIVADLGRTQENFS